MPKKHSKKASRAAKKPAAAPVSAKPPVTKQPQSKTEAAKSAGMFLKTDDSWAASYFDPNDLHSLDRQLFG